jgi:hypothetical protein
MTDLSRRKLIITGLAATAGVSGLGVAARIAQRYWAGPARSRRNVRPRRNADLRFPAAADVHYSINVHRLSPLRASSQSGLACSSYHRLKARARPCCSIDQRTSVNFSDTSHSRRAAAASRAGFGIGMRTGSPFSPNIRSGA